MVIESTNSIRIKRAIQASAKRAINIGKNSSRYRPELDLTLSLYELADWMCRSTTFYERVTKSVESVNQAIDDLCCEVIDMAEVAALRSAKTGLSQVINILSDRYDSTIDFDSCRSSLAAADGVVDSILRIQSDTSGLGQKEAESQKEASERRRGYAYELLSRVRSAQALFTGAKATATNTRIVVLKGKAGVGKTHALCAMTERMIGKDCPVFMLYGNQFFEKKSLIAQFPELLGIQRSFKNANELLSRINEYAESRRTRSLFIVDGLNEFSAHRRIRNFIAQLPSLLERFPLITFILSIRSGFEDAYLPSLPIGELPVIEHTGFEGDEWDGARKYFLHYGIPLPEVPILHNEFRNPMFLNLFCEAVRNRIRRYKGKEAVRAFRGTHSMTDILEDYIREVGDRTLKALNLPPGRVKGKHPVWDLIVKEIAQLLVSRRSNLRYVTDVQLKQIVKKSSIFAPAGKIIESLERNGILAKFPSTSSKSRRRFHYYFTYERFGSYLIVRYLLKGLNFKDAGEVRRAFSKKGKVGRLIRGYNFAFVDALSCAVPERAEGMEVFHAAPWAKTLQHVQEAFLDSLVWRNPSSFAQDPDGRATHASDYFNWIAEYGAFGRHRMLECLITTAPIPTHPFNARILDAYLRRLKMPERDYVWSININYLASEDGAVERLLSWASNREHHKKSCNDVAMLLVTTLTWFFTSSNRNTRDRATKAVINLLQDRSDLWVGYIKRFNEIDDPYLVERIYAVIYGCVLRRFYRLSKKRLGATAAIVFDLNFAKPPRPHILLRDYARQIVELAYDQGCLDGRPISLARPPYGTERWELSARPKEELEKLLKRDNEPGYDPLLTIWLSVMSMGDFARYIIGTNSQTFPFVNIRLTEPLPSKIEKQHKVDHELIQCWIFERVLQLGWSAELHGSFDRERGYSPRNETRKVERIGKKYQWIAYHEILARYSDNYHFASPWSYEKERKFEGPWQDRISRRDFDPSIQISRSAPYERDEAAWWKGVNEIDWQQKVSELDWVSTDKYFPAFGHILRVRRPSASTWYLNLNTIDAWNQHQYKEIEKYGLRGRTLFVKLKSFFVRKKAVKRVIRFLESEEGGYENCLSPLEWHSLYHGEIHRAFAYFDSFQKVEFWPRYDRKWAKIACELIPTSEEFHWSGHEYDGSLADSVGAAIPSLFFSGFGRLIWKGLEGRYESCDSKMVCFDPSAFTSGPRALLVSERELTALLDRFELDLIWSIDAGKEIFTAGSDRPGIYRLRGAVLYNNGSFSEYLNGNFESWR